MCSTKIGLDRDVSDQFYTKPDIAKLCFEKIELLYDIKDHCFMEPSAGAGAFLNLCPPGSVGYDIDPKCDNIIKGDFLTVNFISLGIDVINRYRKTLIMVGNPPFGRQSKLARQFITKSCEISKIIAFILPKSFKKPSMQKCFQKCYHLILCDDLPDNSFIVDGHEHNTPTVFQIWERKDYDRKQEEKVTEQDWYKFVKNNECPDISIRRVGVNAGAAKLFDSSHSPQSHYFIKLKTIDLIETVLYDLEYLTEWSHNNTVGPRSISKNELKEILNSISIE